MRRLSWPLSSFELEIGTQHLQGVSGSPPLVTSPAYPRKSRSASVGEALAKSSKISNAHKMRSLPKKFNVAGKGPKGASSLGEMPFAERSKSADKSSRTYVSNAHEANAPEASAADSDVALRYVRAYALPHNRSSRFVACSTLERACCAHACQCRRHLLQPQGNPQQDDRQVPPQHQVLGRWPCTLFGTASGLRVEPDLVAGSIARSLASLRSRHRSSR